MKEESLLTGKLEPSTRPYALARIAGIEMCRACNQQSGIELTWQADKDQILSPSA